MENIDRDAMMLREVMMLHENVVTGSGSDSPNVAGPGFVLCLLLSLVIEWHCHHFLFGHLCCHGFYLIVSHMMVNVCISMYMYSHTTK